MITSARLRPAGTRAIPVALGLLAALIAWAPVLAAVGWGSTYRASNYHAYTEGNALARTVTSGGTTYLHQVSVQYVIGGVEATDTGPYIGIYYRRGNSSASSWSSAKRLSSSTSTAEYPKIASSGKYVYVAWRRQPHASVDDWNGVDPRPLQFRRNTNHGSSSYWKSQPTFTGADRIDFPAIAATGSTVYIAYTDAIGGEIRLQKSTDNGATFSYKGAIGATTALREGGYSGRAQIAATGSTVAIAWHNGSSLWLKISTDGGKTWVVDTDIPGVGSDWDLAAASGKVGLAWIPDGQHSVVMRRFNGTSLGTTRTVAVLGGSTGWDHANHVAIAMSGTSVIGVAWNACTTFECTAASLRWRESRDAGAHWASTRTVGSYTASASRRGNEHPSIVWAGSSRRVVSWTSYGNSAAYPERVLVRVGTGTP